MGCIVGNVEVLQSFSSQRSHLPVLQSPDTDANSLSLQISSGRGPPPKVLPLTFAPPTPNPSSVYPTHPGKPPRAGRSERPSLGSSHITPWRRSSTAHHLYTITTSLTCIEHSTHPTTPPPIPPPLAPHRHGLTLLAVATHSVSNTTQNNIDIGYSAQSPDITNSYPPPTPAPSWRKLCHLQHGPRT